MARWKLVEPHYLNLVDKTEWEYGEIDMNGRPRKIRVTVPRLLDPRDPGDWTTKWGNRDNSQGEIIVCQPGKGESSDLEFFGDPTPGMSPVDDEARTISASYANLWKYKPEDSSGTYSQSLIDQFDELKASMAANASTGTVKVEGLDTLIAAMAEQSKAIAALVTRDASSRRT
jgi:hypothetical protein